jgi:hypothetical protein
VVGGLVQRGFGTRNLCGLSAAFDLQCGFVRLLDRWI